MRAFIQKEYRASLAPLLVPVVVLGLLAALHRLIAKHQSHEFAVVMSFLFIAAAPYLGALPFGHEFDHGTLSLCLLEPKARMRVWAEKLLVAMVLLLALTCVGLSCMQSAGLAASGMELWLPIFWALNALCSGPMWAFLTRSTIGAAGCSFMGSLAQLLCLALAESLKLLPRVEDSTFAAISLIYSGLTLLAGAVLWRRLEVRTRAGAWIQPHSLAGSFRTVASRSVRGEPTLNLLRREWMLQRSNVVLASGLFFAILLASLTAVLTAVGGYWDSMVTSEVVQFLFPVLLIAEGVLVPLLVGIACGNDALLQTSFLIFVQPSRWRREMAVRLGMGLAISLLAGSMPVLLDFWASRSNGSLLPWGALGTPVATSLGYCLSALCFAIGWLSVQVSRTALNAALLATALCAMLPLSWLGVHEWLSPMMTGTPDSWDLRRLMLALQTHPAHRLLFVGTMAGYVALLLRRAFQNSSRLHVARRTFEEFFIGSTLTFLVLQLGLSLWLCLWVVPDGH